MSENPARGMAQVGPPAAEKRPYEVAAPHGATRVDEFYWLRDDTRTDPAVIAYLEAENAYADAVMAPLAELESALYDELVGRLKQDDSSVPYREGDYWYYTRYNEGEQYPIVARRRETLDAAEEIMLDGNALAGPHEFYEIMNWEVSPNQRLLAYLEDTVGRRQATLKIKDLETGETSALAIPGLSSSLAWSADSQTVFYIENDPETLLTTYVKSHRLGTDPADDPVLYEEHDETYYLRVRNSRSKQYVCIDADSTVSSEMRCAPADGSSDFIVFAPRERDFEYQADHLGNRWVIRTNWNARNFKLMTVADGVWGGRDAWRDLVAHDDAVFIDGYELFDDFIAIGERSDGLTRIRIVPNDASRDAEYIAADEPAYAMDLAVNAEPATDWLRYRYTSLTTPPTTYEQNVVTGERRLLKEEPVLGDFDKANYTTERLWARARDGMRVPVSVVYRNGFVADGTAPLLQYGYGSYGLSSDPAFDRDVISLLDRGVVYAIAHVRGGQEMGRAWYEDGKLLNKRNTFTDFIDVTDFLVEQGYADPTRVAAAGGSAGGLLVGAVANMAPEKYRVIVTRVPFVDIVTTMLDPSIPLTTNEYDEWGNPEDPVYYDYMLSYSPYDQIAERDYPAFYISTGLWDSQVQYFEPAKYVARLRDRKADDDLVVFRIEMEGGHSGPSGRFNRYRDKAEQYAFLLDQLGLGT
ncbi:MAG: S9 family peptidase [Gammaproteobacteria bacterium]|nr:S9 family peptidase [Gammaproteobacteria bacterium]